MLYYKGLIEMRKHYDIFTNPSTEIANVNELGSGLLAVTFDDGNGGQALVVINPHNTNLPYTLEGQWNLIANGDQAGAAVLAAETGSVTVDGISLQVYINDKLAK
jgi:hypothetical protein